ncbi:MULTISPECIES: response regulator [Arthrospira]|jgi:twitching motility two-component system response regulator PilG|uniref:Protein PatA n=1 Tax=Limnospira platensis NIES-46 TaxID=1236695 RepID=A0A5M3T440_LIMPL|nr:response regulator [Arthrospira platensis]AMW28391.1 two-component system response regulator [Arthrospira platensis YZ]KDR56594.1 chemotaxis protein CheY [Arthrospira platensis str. Paraca]MBD2672054.1 DUF4388 domain-containing protein [Arthrospira platensis FACHB-439]MBD2713128.1 DUF4388 domain-containing protein [Arthrospira platensis FACHB-835]MDF2209581.1 response regulator [Arthrospira platensis NCB002]MDT9185508.1 response regulator [Limnospira sp. PMC 289.06]MDT9313366.1 response r
MQGSLNEIDIRSILQLVEVGQRTGQLMVEAYSPAASVVSEKYSDRFKGNCWLVFCSNGRIVYAGESEGSLKRLRDYLHRYKLTEVLNELEVPSITAVNAPEYGYLWVLLEQNAITPTQGRSILHGMISETLFDLLSLHHGAFNFEMGSPLAPQLMTLQINTVLPKIMKQVQEWKTFHPHIQSPSQCPLILDPDKLRQVVRPNVFETLTRWADGKTTFRQISRYLNRDIVAVTKAIYPFVQQGFVQLRFPPTEPSPYPRSQFESKIPRIVCIDDDRVIRETVELILTQHGYEATAIGHPLKALSQVFQLKPDLILCDIAMPELNGYEICAMLRSSSAFRETPIIMLTGIDGFIDRLKARMVRATNYLTKPFSKGELLTLVENYIGTADGHSLKLESQLAEAFSHKWPSLDSEEHDLISN